jgi:hypothetical protein
VSRVRENRMPGSMRRREESGANGHRAPRRRRLPPTLPRPELGRHRPARHEIAQREALAPRATHGQARTGQRQRRITTLTRDPSASRVSQSGWASSTCLPSGVRIRSIACSSSASDPNETPVAAPWLFVRGDHELCSRAGPGWFRFLDPGPMPATCQDVTAPYFVDLGRLRMLVLDTARASDRPPLNPDPYVSQFAALRAMAGRNAWLLAHKPMWGLLPDSSGASVTVLNPTLQAASGNSLPPGVRLVLTGRIHLAEVLGFAGDRPPQIVAGISGNLLLPEITAPLVGMDVAGETLATATTLARHGFFTFVPRPRGWAATIRDVDGKPIARCRLRGRSAACGQPRR